VLTMPITILPPAPPPLVKYEAHSDDDDEMDLDSDEEMEDGAYKNPKLSSRHVITPGEMVTDDTQWMR
jgi:exosome complex component RRP4